MTIAYDMPSARHRSKTTIEPKTWERHTDGETTTGVYDGLTIQEDSYDYPTPNYVSRSKRGEIINTSFLSRKTLIEYSDHMLDIVNGTHNDYGTIAAYNGNGSSYRLSNDYLPSVQQAIVNLHSKINEADWQSLVSIAEARETVESVGSVLYDAMRLIREARRLNVGRFKKLLSRPPSRAALKKLPKAIANQWLRWRYGIRPLIGEAEAISRSWAAVAERPFVRKTFRAKGDTIDTSDSWTSTSPSYWGEYRHKHSENQTTSVYSGALVEADTSVYAPFTRSYGLDDIPTAGWELIPFSFVVDWFLDVGGWIQSWDSDPSLSILASWVTVKDTHKKTDTRDGFDFQKNPPFPSISIHGSRVREERALLRIANPDIPYLPPLKVRLNTSKIADLVSLVLTNFRPRGTRR